MDTFDNLTAVAYRFKNQTSIFERRVEIADDGVGFRIEEHPLNIGDWVVLEDGEVIVLTDVDFQNKYIHQFKNFYNSKD